MDAIIFVVGQENFHLILLVRRLLLLLMHPYTEVHNLLGSHEGYLRTHEGFPKRILIETAFLENLYAETT